MGRRDIATFLVDRGAQLDLFAAAMLGGPAAAPVLDYIGSVLTRLGPAA